ncbi:MAG: glycoside hydrolase family 31 protein, partial [Planctomycetia bacterium]|nr:glycoside hydrolase family 31 protein [Planctomycetia bacterium]
AKRGMLLSRYGGLGSHRYGVYFTGDTSCQWEVLRKQCEFNIRAGHVGISYITHDIGGLYHLPAPLLEPNMYIRWLQFGVFNPVLRFHSFPGAGSRLPWDYGEENRTIGIRWLKFRNSLMPYIYTAARRHYETGTPIVRGLFFEHPRDAESRRFDIFFFGNDLVVAPVLADDEHREVYLPKGTWYDYTTGEKVRGGARFTVFPTLADVPMYAKAGSIIVRQDDSMVPAVSHVDDLILDVFHGAGGAAELYEDDGTSSEYKKAGFGRTAFTLKDTAKALTLTGEALKGKAFGPSRRITVNVVLDSAPKSALLNGAKLSARRVSYDADTRRCTLQLGRVSVKKAWRLTVRK